ncbi:MAG TPA: CPBP family intramembrane metalloprotease, partial [Tenuifilaceae bacterium]|nr:CPBP family intramembrane metalloprotease [Tenuifilaceae bacterium]
LSKNAFSFITAVILAPVLEELLFRGIILKGFLKNYSPVKAIVVSGLLFGIFHLNPWQAIGASFVGVILGWVYYKTKSIIPCIIIHFVNNLLAFILYNATNDADGTIMEMFSSTSLYLVFYFAIIAITTIGLLIIAKKQETINPD